MGTMKVTEKYTIDKAFECENVFRTTDMEHPGVAKVMGQADVNLAGPVKVLSESYYPEMFKDIYQRPSEARQIFEERGVLLKPPYYYEPLQYAVMEDEYPLHLQLYTPMAQAVGPGAANLPHLHELYGLHIKHLWGNWVELNPETAHELGIADGDEVGIESPVGKIRLPVRLYEGAQPDTVSIPAGLGHPCDCASRDCHQRNHQQHHSHHRKFPR